jgi:hypothetical protein
MLAAFQEAFVSLAADARLRRSFARDPLAALAPFALAEHEHAALCGIPREQLERFARSLVVKRWGELARVVPLALRVSPGLPQRHRAWALEHPAQAADSPLPPGVAEGLRVLPALHAELAGDPVEACYTADLFAFEVLRAAARSDGVARMLRSRFALLEIAADVQRGLLPIDPEPQPTELCFERSRVRWRSS